MNNLAEWLKEHKKEFKMIIITVDWHPVTHCSFDVNKGQWPVHCVQYSEGAAIYQPILHALNDVEYYVLKKGLDEDHEEYSIWKNHKSSVALHGVFNLKKITDVNIVGLAGDICVFNSLKDGMKEMPQVKFHFMKEFSPCIGDGKEVDDFIHNAERADFEY
jgi:nicotinamidase/pyrazinamidase